MTWTKFLNRLDAALNTKLLSLGETHITPRTLVTVLVILVLTVVVSRLLRRGVVRLMRSRGLSDDGTAAAVAGLLHYAVLLVGFGVAMQTAGFNLNALFAAGAVFAVGLGFAMQNIVQNFVAGIILLVERSIKPGDVLEVQNTVVKVLDMAIRTTIVQSRDGENLIVPNSVLAQSTVKNFTHKGAAFRVRATVGVVYSSDMALVRRVLERVAAEQPWRLQDRDPLVIMVGFGSSSVDFEASVWMNDPWRSRPALSRLNEAIWWALKEAGITIAFPQLDVHFDEPVSEGLRQLSVVRS